MQVLYQCCCGLDVHKKSVTACLLDRGTYTLRQFGTMTSELRRLIAWLTECQCEMIAMESTSVYWKPLYNLFEVNDLNAMVVNAAHMKALPGRKTDVKDAEWIADLLCHGLLKASFIPDREQRELRELARYRKSMIEERARELNRLQKMLEGANIKLDSVVSDINGKSARLLLERLICENSVTADNVMPLLYGALRSKADQVLLALDGVLTPIQRTLLAHILSHIDDMTERIALLDSTLEEHIQQYEQVVATLDEIPGIARRSAEVIITEIGVDMSRFPTAAHLCSWAGLCPGNNESAGRRRSGKITKGNKALKTTLVECASTASRMKGTFFYAQYRRISARRGHNRAVVAVAHSMLIAIYHMLSKHEAFVDLGVAYYDAFDREKRIQAHLRKLQELGWSPLATAAN